jgi:hypothetical protein
MAWCGLTNVKTSEESGRVSRTNRAAALCQDLPLAPPLLDLWPQQLQLFLVLGNQAVLARALVTLGLCRPVADRLRRRLVLPRHLLRRPARANELDQFAGGDRVNRNVVWPSWTPFPPQERSVHEVGSTPDCPREVVSVCCHLCMSIGFLITAHHLSFDPRSTRPNRETQRESANP